MSKPALQELSIILGLGTFVQWFCWRFRLPTIVFLLLSGFLVGPVFGLIEPDKLFGESLSPIVSLSVAVILYEGGLSLRFSELPGVKRVIFSLISLGMVTTWVVGAVAAHYLLGLSLSLSILLGAILTVSGPTVIVPLLRDVKPRAPIGTILRWEGILIDPVGALAAVLVFELVSSPLLDPTSHFAIGALKAIASGAVFGGVGAWVVATLMSRYWIPDHLHNPVSLGSLFLFFTISEVVQPESGLLTATLMGVILANTKGLNIHHLIEFKENLQVLLISSLFVLLSARVELEAFTELGFSALAFLLVIIFVARPLAVLVSTVGSDLGWRERCFISLIYPRGIVAAAVASLFAIQLVAQGHEEGALLVSYTFLVIVGCGVFYGIGGVLFARLLKISAEDSQGILFVGANQFARSLALELKKLGFPVMMVDSNWTNVATAKLQGIPVYRGNILSEYLLDELDLDGIGRLFALTPNDEANSLASVRYSGVFGRADVYQLPSESLEETAHSEEEHPAHLRGRFLFHLNADYYQLEDWVEEGAGMFLEPCATKEEYDELSERFGETLFPIVMVQQETMDLEPFTTDFTFREKAGQEILLLGVQSSDSAE